MSSAGPARSRRWARRVKGWLVTAIVTPAIATGWAIGGEVLKDDLTHSRPPPAGQVERPTGGTTVAEQLLELQQLFDARKSGVIRGPAYNVELQKILSQPVTE